MLVIFPNFLQKTIILLIVFLIASGDHICLLVCAHQQDAATKSSAQSQLTWPGKQLNVLLDERSLNQSERSIIELFLAQIEGKTCIRVNRLSAQKVNPFDPNQHLFLDQAERNYIYIFKSQFGVHKRAHQSMGLSLLGCVRQGRQSLVLTDSAFKWPQLVLRYHILRSLGLKGIDRPDRQLDELLKELPLNQKIASDEPVAKDAGDSDPAPALFAFGRKPAAARAYLDAQDIFLLKQLYGCPDYQNKLSATPQHGNVPSALVHDADRRPSGQHDGRGQLDAGRQVIGPSGDLAAESIVDDLLDSSPDSGAPKNEETSEKQETTTPLDQTTAIEMPEFNNQLGLSDQCKPLDACPIEPRQKAPFERPMLLKLDSASAHDPHLNQANQMKLSQVNNDTLATYRLLEAPASSGEPAGRNEMMISFEQQGDAISSLFGANSLAKPQVLKLCSCTCQTMVPAEQGKSTSVEPSPSSSSSPATERQETGPAPTTTTSEPSTSTSALPTPTPTEIASPKPTASTWPWTGQLPDGSSSELDTSTTAITTSSAPPTEPPEPATSTLPAIITTEEPQPTNTMTTSTSSMSSITDEQQLSTGSGSNATDATTPSSSELPEPVEPTSTTMAANAGACDQVQWVQPNKSVYASAKIVWDMDRANQNYFICQNELNKELLPGKTNGFSCKVSQQGRAYELHQFRVLTKPESVNLAWIQRNSETFGKSNLPVVGGHSAGGDPYIVGRCMVRDENNDVITLIGYVNTFNSGWFPFDDIQIECDQYDVLACVT